MRAAGALLPFALRTLRRELRSGELRVLLLALAIGVAAFAAVALFTDRIRLGMERQAGELLAADLVVQGTSPLPPEWSAEALGRGVRTGEVREFRSVVRTSGRMQLAEVKSVDAGYPLRGELRIADRVGEPERVVDGPPPAGNLWVERNLLPLLGANVGDALELGEARLTIAGVIAWEPDRGGSLFSIAPRVLMNGLDLESTHLLGLGSRVDYRLLLAGEVDRVEAMRDWLKPRLRPGDQLLGGRDSRPQLTSALERAERFLGLASLVGLLLAAVAIALAAHRFAHRHQDTGALLRCLGASRRKVAGIFTLQLLLLGLLGSALGILIGWITQFGLGALLGDLLVRELPPPSLTPLLRALLVGLITLAGFALPPLLALRNTPPLRVLRDDLPPVRPGRLAGYGPAVVALLLLMGWQAQDLKLTLMVFGGSLGTLALLAGVAWVAVRLLSWAQKEKGITQRTRREEEYAENTEHSNSNISSLRSHLPSANSALSSSIRHGLTNIHRRTGASVVLIMAFGLGLMVLLLLTLVRTDLLAAWRNSLPPDTPNQFLINIQRDQLEPLRGFFQEQGVAAPEFLPMVRGRLRSVDGRPVRAEDYENPRAQRLVQREFNLSWMERPVEHNPITKGDWWEPGATGEWSMETGIAETLGIPFGAELAFDVAGQEVVGKVTSLRRVEWDSFRVNFFVVAPPGQLPEDQASYITAFHLPAERPEIMVRLVERFPNVTAIDVEAIMQRVRGIIEKVILSVEFISLFTLLAGFVVLYAAIQTSLEERKREGAILRTLGARKGQIRGALAAEFIALGLLAGAIASVAAISAGAVLAGQLFDLAYSGNPLLWIIGPLAGALALGGGGIWGTRRVLREPPLRSLRGE